MNRLENFKDEFQSSKRVRKKTLILMVLIVLLVADIIYVSCFRNRTVTETEDMIPDKTDQTEESRPDTENENVPYFGTTATIRNLDEQAGIMLGTKTKLLEQALTDHCQESPFETYGETAEGEIFYSLIRNEDEAMKLIFFCLMDDTDEIVELTYDYGTEKVSANKSSYTEEDIINEVWQGEAPAIRDIDE